MLVVFKVSTRENYYSKRLLKNVKMVHFLLHQHTFPPKVASKSDFLSPAFTFEGPQPAPEITL